MLSPSTSGSAPLCVTSSVSATAYAGGRNSWIAIACACVTPRVENENRAVPRLAFGGSATLRSKPP
jgi:hypothetical protein